MNSRFLAGVAAATLAVCIGSDSLIDGAQSLTIPSLCVDGELCAALCRAHVEDGRTPEDFIQRAAYELGPAAATFKLPPANMNMPPLVDPKNVYASIAASDISPATAGALNRVYAPNLITGKVDVIDPETFQVVDSYFAIPSPQHIVPSWDLQTLWVSGDISYRGGHASVAAIDPKTGKVTKTIDLPDAYNMYFTPDGRSAIVVAEAKRRLEFRDPHTMALQGYIAAPRCAGINHADFSLDGAYAIFTCEYDDTLAKIDLVHHTLAGMLQLSPGHIPQDIRIAPDGSAFFVADMLKDGLIVDRRRRLQGDRLHPDRRRRARALSQPRRQAAVHLQPRHPQSRRRAPRRRQRLGDGFRHAQDRRQLDDPRRRQPRHGQRLGRRQISVAVGPLRRRRLRLQHRRRLGEDDPGRRHAARPHRLAATGALLARAHRQHAMSCAHFP